MKRRAGNMASSSRAERGVAAIEFALVLPILLALLIGIVNAGALLTMKRSLSIAADLMVDLVTRHVDNIAGTDIDDYIIAAQLSLGKLAPGVRMDVYDYYKDAGGVVRVRWSKFSAPASKCLASPLPVVLSSADPVGRLLLTSSNDVVRVVVCGPFSGSLGGITLGGLLPNFKLITVRKEAILSPRQSTVLNCTSGCS